MRSRFADIAIFAATILALDAGASTASKLAVSVTVVPNCRVDPATPGVDLAQRKAAGLQPVSIACTRGTRPSVTVEASRQARTEVFDASSRGLSQAQSMEVDPHHANVATVNILY